MSFNLSKKKKIVLYSILGLILAVAIGFVAHASNKVGFAALADYVKNKDNFGTIHVTVLNQYDEPLPNVSVLVIDDSNIVGDPPTVIKNTDNNGEAVFYNIPYSSRMVVTAGPTGNGQNAEFGPFRFDQQHKNITLNIAVDAPPNKVNIFGEVFGEQNEIEGGVAKLYKDANCRGQAISWDNINKDQYRIPDGRSCSFLFNNLDRDSDYCLQFYNFPDYQDKNFYFVTNRRDEYQMLTPRLERQGESNKFALKGRITDKDSNAIIQEAQIEVSRSREGEVLYQTESAIPDYNDDHSSNYRIEDMPVLETNNNRTDYYYIRAKKEGYENGFKALQDVDVNQPETIIDFELEESQSEPDSATIGGKVTIKTNRSEISLSRGKVELIQGKPNVITPNNIVIAETETDLNGNYNFEIGDATGIDWGEEKYIKAYTNPGAFEGRNETFPEADGLIIRPGDNITDADIVINVKRTLLCGKVYKSENSEPLSGATVIARAIPGSADSYPKTGKLQEKTTTDRDGSYCLTNLRGNFKYKVIASYDKGDEQRTTAVQHVRVNEKQYANADFYLSRNPDCQYGGALTGKVFDREGNPVEGAMVTMIVNKADLSPALVDHFRTQSGGNYYFPIRENEVGFYDSVTLSVVKDDITNDRYSRHHVVLGSSGETGDFSCPPLYNYNFYVTTQGERRWPEDKDVEVRVIKKYQENGQWKEEPYSNVQAKLVSENNTEGDQTGFVYSTSSEQADETGRIFFRSIPRTLEYRVAFEDIDKAYYIEDVSKRTISPNSYSTEIVLKMSTIDNPWVWDDIYMAQNDPRWVGEEVGDFRTHCCIGDGGCCITSASMAIKYFYPDKQVTPPMFLEANGGRGLFNTNNCLRTKRMIAYVAGTSYQNSKIRVSNKVRNWSAIISAVNNGFPVVVHTKGHGWDSHGGHCVLVVKHHGGRTFTVLDPHPLGAYDKYETYTVSDSDKLNFGIIFRPREASHTGQVDTGDKQEEIKENEDVEVEVDIDSNTADKPQSANLEVIRERKEKIENLKEKKETKKTKEKKVDSNDLEIKKEDYEEEMKIEKYPMKKVGNSKWKAVAPGFKNKEAFSYRVESEFNDGRKRVTGWETMEVKEDKTISSKTRGLFSRVKYYFRNSLPYKYISQGLKDYNNWLDRIRKMYLVGNSKGDIYGAVKATNNQPLKNALVRVGDKQTITDNKGLYSLKGLNGGEYEIKITGPNGGEYEMKAKGGNYQNSENIFIEGGAIIIRDYIVK